MTMHAERGSSGPCLEIVYRYELQPGDREVVRKIVHSTGFFHVGEVDVAVELVDERMAKGPSSGYHFVFADSPNGTVGYTCYGPIAATQESYDLFWIAVDPSYRGKGLGQALMLESERMIRQAGGRRVYIETSNREQYRPTRGFYDRCKYTLEAVLKDFYAPGDDKAVYVKVLE